MTTFPLISVLLPISVLVLFSTPIQSRPDPDPVVVNHVEQPLTDLAQRRGHDLPELIMKLEVYCNTRSMAAFEEAVGLMSGGCVINSEEKSDRARYGKIMLDILGTPDLISDIHHDILLKFTIAAVENQLSIPDPGVRQAVVEKSNALRQRLSAISDRDELEAIQQLQLPKTQEHLLPDKYREQLDDMLNLNLFLTKLVLDPNFRTTLHALGKKRLAREKRIKAYKDVCTAILVFAIFTAVALISPVFSSYFGNTNLLFTSLASPLVLLLLFMQGN
uniref:Uncharacterized protein n=1 Tax=Spongospora subterranea TaxID=70186 RepID=A0A0H5R435_9EUKA|eukprot:CRZ08903.1 hypothetical protein [Spongospora subterranea]